VKQFIKTSFLALGFFATTTLSAQTPAPAAATTQKAKEHIILCLGDSLTEGYGVPIEKSWPSLMQEHFAKQNVKVLNSGISGATSASGPGRLKWHLKSPEKPEIMILALGANDGLRGQPVASMKENLSKTIVMAKESGIRPVLAGMRIPPNYGQEYADAFEKVFVDLAKEHSIGLIPFLLDGVAARKELNLPDGIHPNPDGYKIVIKNVLQIVEPMLKDE
jgi:acyl-CoA thioesterase-1